MKWFRSLSTLAKVGVLAGGVFFLCIGCAVFAAFLPDATPEPELTQEQLIASAMAQLQVGAQQTDSALAAQVTATDPATDTPEPTEDPNLFRSGTYIVGTDIQPGFYKGYAGLDLLDSCYWARLSDLSGEFEALIANDNAEGQFYIEVRDTDFALEVACNFEYLPALPESDGNFPTALLPGTYLVNRDIQPGTYQGQAGADLMESCYWERLTNVAGGFEGIIANDNAQGQFYVQISASDFAFSTGCELTRIGD
jgi:hypothetical protein